ncbi:MAG: FecR family protein [Bacteroidota bacterium]
MMNTDEKHNIPVELIIRTLSDEASLKEQEQLKAWRTENEANEKAYQEFIGVWQATGKVKPAVNLNMDAEWNRMEQAIDQRSGLTSGPATKPSPGWIQIIRLAAGLALILGLSVAGYYIFRGLDGERLITDDSIASIELPDGSTVTLNRESKLRYPAEFEIDRRKIILEGEAYFEVSADPERPFIIETKQSRVEVLGTSFTVKAYEETEDVEVVVASGMVSLSPKKMPEKRVVLKPGELGTLNPKNEDLEIVKNTDENFLSWKTRHLEFDNAPLGVITQKLEEVYGKDIIIENEALRACPVTVTFDDMSLEAVLNILQSTLDLRIETSGNTVRISGDGC